ncbi:MAG: MMPL family transporter [Dermatophilaceae bacterium]
MHIPPDSRHGVVLRRWGRTVARRARLIVLLWVVFIAAALVAALGAFGTPSLFDRLDSGEVVVDGENRDGRRVLEQAGSTGFGTYTLTVEGVDLTDPQVAAAATDAAQRLTGLDRVVSAVNPFVVPGGSSSPSARPFLRDGDPDAGGFATVVTFDPTNTAEQEATATAAVDTVFDELVREVEAESARRGGLRTLVDRIVEQVRIDAQRGEGIALPVSFLVMVVVFGGLLAASIPVFGAVASIAGALVSLLGFSYLFDLDASVVNVVTVLGLGLCIDYGLLVVSRFREEMRGLPRRTRRVRPPPAHIALVAERTMERAGRTVIFSALTVAVSLAGLLVLDIDFVRAVSVAGVSVVLLALAVALTLIPALCVLGAHRLLRAGVETSGDAGVFTRLARAVHGTPWLVIGLVTGVLVLLTVPATRMELTSSAAELLPKGTPEREFAVDLRDRYPLLAGAEVVVVTRGTPVAEVQAWAADAASRPGVESVDPVRVLPGGVATVGFQTGDTGAGAASRELTADLREGRPPFAQAWVVGQASGITDFRQTVADRALWAVGAVVLATLVLLFLMTGSVVIPVKALVMNVLSLGATLGVLVWVFQDGNLEGLLGFTSVGGVEATVPLLVLAFGFGLSMDYEVFLLSRIVELHAQGHDTRSAVTRGLQRSGRIITSAALLMVIVFAGFAAGDLLVLKQTGVALVLAVVIDATVVRMLLVPATMSVLGSANWWAPAPLRRLHERFGIVG